MLPHDDGENKVVNIRPLIATDGLAWSLRVSVCWSRRWVLQKRRNRSRCSLGTAWAQGNIYSINNVVSQCYNVYLQLPG